MTHLTNTINGRVLDLVAPAAEDICIHDIVWSLDRIVRFNGHVRGGWTVLDHSLYCAELAAPEAKLYALLHDAHEAYTGDITRPMQMAMAAIAGIEAASAIRVIQARIDSAIRAHFGIPEPSPDIIAEVKRIDMIALHMERIHFLHPRAMTDTHWGPLPEACAIPPVKHGAAAFAFERALEGLLEQASWGRGQTRHGPRHTTEVTPA